jgi:hypothetical protein
MRFRKKPIVIDAIQWTGENAPDVLEFSDFALPVGLRDGKRTVTIPTPEGEMIAHVGDWIIRGVKGEYYPCKPDIFEATYEFVSEDEPC